MRMFDSTTTRAAGPVIADPAARRARRRRRALGLASLLPVSLAVLVLGGCGFLGSESEAREADAPARAAGGPGGGRGGASRAGGFPGFGGSSSSTAIPIQVAKVERREISQYLETNGTLQAENDVDLVARTSGPIVELLVEEGLSVTAGQLLARIDPAEILAQIEISKVNMEDAQLAFDRAKKVFEEELISNEVYDQARSKLEGARAQLSSNDVQLSYTEIRAPFSGLIVERHIKFAQHVQNGTALFRISDFDPLECPIQVPEKDLGRLRNGQPAYLNVEAFGEQRFDARVLRISPVVDAATGTVKVTLQVETRGKLRPGMFASVFLETDRHQNALVVPKSALVLESIGDTVYIKDGDVASRRQVRLGYDEADHVEVLEGLSESDEVIVLGQDSLSEGTPVYVLDDSRPAAPKAGSSTGDGSQRAIDGRPVGADAAGRGPDSGARGGPRGGRGGAGGRGMPDPANMTPEMIEMMKERMRGRGLSEKDIEERLEMMKNGQAPGRNTGL